MSAASSPAAVSSATTTAPDAPAATSPATIVNTKQLREQSPAVAEIERLSKGWLEDELTPHIATLQSDMQMAFTTTQDIMGDIDLVRNPPPGNDTAAAHFVNVPLRHKFTPSKVRHAARAVVAAMETLHAEVSRLEVHRDSVREASDTVRYQDEVAVDVVRIEDYQPTARRNVSLSRADLRSSMSSLELESLIDGRSVQSIEIFVRNPSALDPTAVHKFDTMAEMFEGDWVPAFQHMLFRRGTEFATVKLHVAEVESESGESEAPGTEAVESGSEAAESGESESEAPESEAAESESEAPESDEDETKSGKSQVSGKRRRSATKRFDIVAASEQPQHATSVDSHKKKRQKKARQSSRTSSQSSATPSEDNNMDFTDVDPVTDPALVRIIAPNANGEEKDLLNRDGMPRKGTLKGMNAAETEDAELLKLLFACELKNNGKTRTYAALLPCIGRALGNDDDAPPPNLVGPGNDPGSKLQGKVRRNNTRKVKDVCGNRKMFMAKVGGVERLCTIEWNHADKRLYYAPTSSDEAAS